MTKDRYVGIGLMSGTSLDGLDIVSVEFTFSEGLWSYQLLNHQTKEYPEKLLSEVRQAIKSPLADHHELDNSLGKWMGHSTWDFITKNKLQVDYIASHGQTIYHNPSDGLTIQLGNGRIMADSTQTTVVNNFRIQDVQLGGQGAPLVPMGDLHLFKEYAYCLNLGGIANLSIKEEEMKAFDICICNAGINALSNKIGLPFDKGGKVGSRGKILPDLLKAWNSLEYMLKDPPKSLDAAFFNNAMWSDTIFGNYKVEDCIRTLYEHIADQISKVILKKNERILLTGGGAFNDFLVQLMKDTYGLRIHLPDEKIIEYKEAMIFAFLGLLRLKDEVNVLSSVTGAAIDHCAGIIHEK